MTIDIEEWKKGIPQRELEQKIKEYEEDYPKREKMTPQARENNQTRFFLEDRFYELHKKQLAELLAEKAAEEARKAAELQKKLDTAAGIAAKFDDGFSFGFGKKIGGAFNGVFAGAMDALLTDKTFGQAYTDRYNEIVGDAVQKGRQFEEEHPAAAMTTELVGSVLNPVNQAGGGALLSVGKAVKNATKLQKAATLGKTALASGAIGAGTGALTAAGQAQSLDEFGDRVVSDTLSGGVLGAVMPGAEAAVKKAWTVAAPKASAAFRTFSKLENSGAMKNVSDVADRAVAKDRAMPEVADDTVNGLLREARQQTPAANEILDNAYGKISQGEAARTQREIERFARPADVERLVNKAERYAEPAFNRLKNIEDVDAYALGRNGSKELAGRLKSQKFRDINFGRLDSRKLEQINAIRATEGLEALTPDMKIPENVVRKFYNKRVVHDKMTPENVADTAFDVFYNPDSIVDASKYPHIQALIKPDKTTSNVGFIAQNPANGETVVKSAYREKSSQVKNLYSKVRETLEGRTQHQSGLNLNPEQTYLNSVKPSSLGPETGSLRQTARFSDVQSLPSKGVSSMNGNVNSGNMLNAAKNFKEPLNDLSVQGKRSAQMKTDFVAENINDVSLQPVYRTHFLTHVGTNPVPNDEVILSPLGRYVNRDKIIQDEIFNVRQDKLRLSGADTLPDTSFDMLNEVNRGLNEKIAAARNVGQFDTAANLERHQQELWRQIDGVLPGYGEARSFTDAAQRIPAAEQLGQNIFSPDLKTSHVSQAVNGMNSYEMQGLKSGIGDALKRETGNGAASYGNIFSPAGQQKLGAALGQPGNRSLGGFLKDNVVAQNNRNFVMSGNASEPVEQGIFGRLSSPWRDTQNEYFSRTMTGTPDALRQQYSNYLRGRNYYSPYAVPYLAQQYTSDTD